MIYPPVLRAGVRKPPRKEPAGAWRAMLGGGQARLVVLCRRIDQRQRHGDQLSGARDISLARRAGQQPIVADAMEPLWQDVEQEAPDELVGRECHRAVSRPPV